MAPTIPDAPTANPFTIPQYNAVPNNPFYSGAIQAQTEAQAAPFRQMQQQREGLDLQRRTIETGEFADPRSVDARMSGQDLIAAQNKSKTRMVPKQEEAEMKRLDEEIRSLPSVTDAKIAQAQEATRNARSAPQREMFSQLGQLYPVLSKASETERPFLYLSAMKRMEQLGIRVPDNLKNYDERHLGDLAAIYHAQIFSPEQVGKERITQMGNDNRLDVQALHNQGNVEVANINAGAHRYAADAHREAAETPAKAMARARLALSKNPDDQNAQRELRGYLEEEFDKRFQKDGLANMLQIQAANDPAKQQRYLVYREQQKARLFMNEGLYGDIDTKGRDWVIRAIESNPNYGVEGIVAEGRRLGKIGKKDKK